MPVLPSAAVLPLLAEADIGHEVPVDGDFRWALRRGPGRDNARPGPVLVLLPIATCWGRHRLRLAVYPLLTLALRRVFTRHTT
jgi:hypothetical protein